MRGTAILRRFEPPEESPLRCPACRGELSSLDSVYRRGRWILGCDRCVDILRGEKEFPRCPGCGQRLGADNAPLRCRREIIGCESCLTPGLAADLTATLQPDEAACL